MHDELQEARSKLSRVVVQQTRAIGLETRLSTALQEKDDIQQERDNAIHRSKLADARISGLKERCGKCSYDKGMKRGNLYFVLQ